MRLYEVEYTKNDWTDALHTTKVAASSTARAVEFVAKSRGKYVGSSGRVTAVKEIFFHINVAK